MRSNGTSVSQPGILLVGPYDPLCDEYTSLAPPLGIWRLSGVLEAAGFRSVVFDPNCCEGPAPAALERMLRHGPWLAVGFSTTSMTVRYDLELAQIARRALPNATLIAGGSEATRNPDLLFRMGPFDLVVMGEGERPMVEVARRLRANEPIGMIPGTATAGGVKNRIASLPLSRDEISHAILHIRYEKIPYNSYWRRLERNCHVGDLAFHADRQERLNRIRAIRLFTGSPNGPRLDAEECLVMLRHIAGAQPEVRTIVFDDEPLVPPGDDRIVPLCTGIIAAKARGRLPRDLRFLGTQRDPVDTDQRAAMRTAGFALRRFEALMQTMPDAAAEGAD